MGKAIQKAAKFVGTASTACVALMLADACSVPAGEAMIRAGDALIDAGVALDDEGGGGRSSAGERVTDASVSDASPAAGGDGSLVRDAGTMLRDAGSTLVDAGTAVHDAGADAMAQVASLFRSGSRIEMRVGVMKGADGSQWAGYPSLYDTARKEPCSLALTADGKQRCIPTMGYGYITFGDAACTVEIFVNILSNGACTPKPAYLPKQEKVDSCGAASVRIFQAGAEHLGTIYTKNGASCTASIRVDAYRYYTFGSEIPASSFVEFTDGGVEILK